jgi:hypothetical protein
LKQHYVESERSYIDMVRMKLENGRVLEEARDFCRRARYPLLPEYFFFEDGLKGSVFERGGGDYAAERRMQCYDC